MTTFTYPNTLLRDRADAIAPLMTMEQGKVLAEARCRALAALLLLAGGSPQRRRALPAPRIAAHAGASNSGF